MAENIEHISALRQLRGQGVVGALVIEQTGFLATDKVGHICRAVHWHRDQVVNFAAKNNGFLVQAFQRARTAISVFQNVNNTCYVAKCCDDIVEAFF